MDSGPRRPLASGEEGCGASWQSPGSHGTVPERQTSRPNVPGRT